MPLIALLERTHADVRAFTSRRWPGSRSGNGEVGQAASLVLCGFL